MGFIKEKNNLESNDNMDKNKPSDFFNILRVYNLFFSKLFFRIEVIVKKIMGKWNIL